MVTLQQRMDNMRPYFRAIEVYNDALIVKVIYPNNWKAYPSEDGRVKVTPSDDPKMPNMSYYYADSNNVTYDDIFDLIEETIKANQDIVLKVELLKEKVEELKELFSKLPYDELKTLRFATESIKTEKPKRKYTKRTKRALEAQECVQEASTEPNAEAEEQKEEQS